MALSLFRRARAEAPEQVAAPPVPTPSALPAPEPMLFEACVQRRREVWEASGRAGIVGTLFNKRLSQAYVRERGLRTPEILRQLPAIDALPEFSELPPRFVLKPIQGSSNHGVFLIENGVNLFDGKSYGRETAIAAVKATERIAAGVPFHIEEFLQNWDGKPGAPNDFKFYNFGPECAFVHVIERNSGRQGHLNRHWFLKPDWTPLGMKIQPTQAHCPEPAPLPPFKDEMLALAQRLSGGLGMFLRVDLYATTHGPVFGEFTPNPHGGRNYVPAADRWLGSLWRGLLGAGD